MPGAPELAGIFGRRNAGHARYLRTHQPYTEMAARALRLWTANERKWKRTVPASDRRALDGSRRRRRVGSGVTREAQGSRRFRTSACRAANDETLAADQFRRNRLGSFRTAERISDWRALACQAVVEGFVAEGGIYRQAAVSMAIWTQARLRLFRSRTGRSFAPTVSSLPAARGWENCFRKPSEITFKRPSRMYSSSARPPEITASTRSAAGMGRPPRAVHVRDSGQSRPRVQGRRRHARADLRSDRWRASSQRGAPAVGPRVPRLPLSRAENAPLLETRVCQYEQTPDSDFIIDRHPAAPHVWLVGGGSGHGFKHGPALGEMVAKLVLKDAESRAALERSSVSRAVNSHRETALAATPAETSRY